MLRPTILLTLLVSLTTALPSLQPRKDDKKKNPKYFHEKSGSQALIHYDARYFAGEEVPYARHRYVLRGLVTSYLDFFEKQGQETWIAHGTLLGWWWNGRIMPWDLDLDVQVTANTMQYMADNHNRSEHAWEYQVPHEQGKHVEQVKTSYLFDINPHQNDTEVDRMNIIDARWIDMKTGMYIDLTVLKERDPAARPGIWACTNNHRYASGDLWPMRVTEFEGVRTLIPKEFEKILADEYGRKGLTVEEFHEHNWNHDIKQWVMNNKDEREIRLADAAAQKQREMNGLDPDAEEPHSHDHSHGEEGEMHDHEHEHSHGEGEEGEAHDHDHSHDQGEDGHDHEHSHEEEPHKQEDDGHDHAPAVPKTETETKSDGEQKEEPKDDGHDHAPAVPEKAETNVEQKDDGHDHAPAVPEADTKKEEQEVGQEEEPKPEDDGLDHAPSLPDADNDSALAAEDDPDPADGPPKDS